MNWYKFAKHIKIASVTFGIGDDGAHKIAQPMDLLSLCSDISNFIWYRAKLINEDFMPTSDNFQPDTSHHAFDGFEGVINVYPRERTVPKEGVNQEEYYQLHKQSLDLKYKDEELSSAEVARLDQIEAQMRDMQHTAPNTLDSYINAVNEWIKDKEQLGFRIEVSKDISNMTEGEILRINIIENPTKDIEEMPSVQMSNDNYLAMARLLGLPHAEEYGGIIAVDQLMQLINQASSEDQMQEAVTPDTYEQNESGSVQMFGQGRDIGYVDGRLQQLYQLADWAKNNNFQYISWG